MFFWGKTPEQKKKEKEEQKKKEKKDFEEFEKMIFELDLMEEEDGDD